MVIETPRDVLSAILRRAAPRIIGQIADEAARSVHAPETVSAYVAWMNLVAPIALDAIAADEPQRARLLAEFAGVEVDSVRRVPPVARVGLLEIGIRLAHAEVEHESSSRPDAIEIQAEFRRFADQLRTALRAAGAVPNGGR